MATDLQQSNNTNTSVSDSILNVCLRIKAQKDQNVVHSAYNLLTDHAFSVKTWKNEVVYNFTQIFKAETGQKEVYDNTAGSSVEPFIKGKDCLMLAYGTTNAGKTYSVQGNHHNPGIVPRTICDIFTAIKGHIDLSPHIAPCNYNTVQIHNLKEKHHIEGLRAQILSNCRSFPLLPLQLGNCSLSFSSALSSTVSADFDPGVGDSTEPSLAENYGWKSSSRCSLWLSMIEVYNENVYDLLSGNKASSKVTITMDMEGRFYPTGQIEIHVNSIEEAKSVIQHGYKQRTKSSTLLNNTSSRSHCILRLRLVRADRAPGGLLMHMGPQSPAACDIEDTTVSTFMICDLAGAERTNKTGEAKGRARETAKINNALVVLRRCINTLKAMGSVAAKAKRTAVVPYRESRLTMILQPLLSDPGPKHFLINISTSQNLLDETINVLNFSSVARKVIVTEQMRSVPHYQLPTSSKQVQAMYQSQLTECTSGSELGSTENLKASDFEEDVDMDSATDTNPPDLDYLIVKVSKDTVGTQTDPEVVDANATQTEEVPDIKKPRLEDRETQTIELIEVDESEVAALKAKIAAAEKLVEENETRHRQRERELFAEFDKLEHEMKEGQKEQLQVKEQQLYSLMEERLQILKTFYKEKVDDMTEKHHELMSKVAAADKAKEDTELALKKSKDEVCNLQTQLAAQKDFCEFTSTSLIEKREENVKITEERNNLKEKLQILRAEWDALKNQSMQATGDVQSKLEKARAELKEKEAQWKLECETANEAYNKDVKNLEKDVKNTLANLMEMENKAEKMEKSTSKYKARCDNLMSKLAETNHELERFRKIAQFLVDSFRPDLRQSLAGSADEEKIWSSLLKEMKAIPSQFVLLKTENCQLKECLQLKEEELEKIKTHRDNLLNTLEKELETTKNQKEEYKRESQKLVQRMMNMTPRKQDDTPQKEFKTPLTPRQQSVTANATLKMSAQKELKTPQKEEEEPEVKEVRSSARKTRNTRKTPVRGSSATKENLEMLEEEAVKPAQKPRRRRLLNSKSLHPALDVDEVPLDIDVTTTSQLSETKRKLRAKYK